MEPSPASPAAPGAGPAPESAAADQRAAIDRVLADYIELYASDTLDRWKRLFHPSLIVAFPDDDVTTRILSLDEFLERQKNTFATGRRIGERLENVRVDEGRRIARVVADFVFMDEGEERPGTLGLHLVQDRDAWKIVAILFSYDEQ
jgi:hypothetical protein